jgi:DNA-binding response OmpR family regulator
VKSKILLVDDDPYTQQLFEGLLRGEDIELRMAANLAEAHTEFHSADFNLVLLDQRLPDGNGLDFFKEIRALRPSKWRSSLPATPTCAMRSAPCAAGCSII